MALWEYKVITSGKGGFASPALLESYINQLGKDEWEIVEFQTHPDNPLAFHGLARRPTQRDWTLEAAAAAAAKVEADKLRAEFSAKFQGVAMSTEPSEETPTSIAGEAAAADDGLRRLRDTERDQDPDAPEEEEKTGDWDDFEAFDEDLPTFFEAIKPHLRKNQKGPGMAVAIDYLAKRWEQAESDLVGALKECGFVLPETEDSPAEYLEFEGDLYWVNRNNRGQFFLNTREKPRPVFRVVQAKKLDPNDPVATVLAGEAAAEQAEQQRQAAERASRQAEQDARRAEAAARREAAIAAAAAVAAAAAAAPPKAEPVASPAPDTPLPAGEELLAKLRPLMRRNRRGPGYSGSVGFLARALKQSEADLIASLAAAGLVLPEKPSDKPVPTEIAGYEYWLNQDGRGGVWINGQEKRKPSSPPARSDSDESTTPSPAPSANEGESLAPASDSVPVPFVPVAEAAPAPAGDPGPTPVEAAGETIAPESTAPVENSAATDLNAEASPLSALRALLKPNKRGSGVSGEIGELARALERSENTLLDTLTSLGMTVPAESEAKPSFLEYEDELLWLNRNAKDHSLWLNAKSSKTSTRRSGGARKPRSKTTPAE